MSELISKQKITGSKMNNRCSFQSDSDIQKFKGFIREFEIYF